MNVTMQFKKSTKNTHVYENPDSDVITTVYVNKASLPKEPPSEIIVEIIFDRNTTNESEE